MDRKELVKLVFEHSGLGDWKSGRDPENDQSVMVKKGDLKITFGPDKYSDRPWQIAGFRAKISFPYLESYLAIPEYIKDFRRDKKDWKKTWIDRYFPFADEKIYIRTADDFDAQLVSKLKSAAQKAIQFFEEFSDPQVLDVYLNQADRKERENFLSIPRPLRRMVIKRFLNTDDYHEYSQRVIDGEFEKYFGQPDNAILRVAKPLYDFMNANEPPAADAKLAKPTKKAKPVLMSEASEPGGGQGNLSGFICSKVYKSAEEIADDFGFSSVTIQENEVELGDSTVSHRRDTSENELDFFVVDGKTIFIVPDIWISDLDFQSASGASESNETSAKKKVVKKVAKKAAKKKVASKSKSKKSDQTIVTFRTYESSDVHQLTIYENGKTISERTDGQGKTLSAGPLPKNVGPGELELYSIFSAIKKQTGIDIWKLPVSLTGKRIEV